MDGKLIRSVIQMIKAEEKRRISELPRDSEDAARDRYFFTDLPFVDELYLMLLVAMWHQIEKELVYLAARADGSMNEISQDDYETDVDALARKRPQERWQEIEKKLLVQNFSDYEALKLLRKLANSYKHEPFGRPGKKLLESLSLPTNAHYGPLPASDETAEGFCKALGLDKAAGYADITEAFLKVAERFLIELKSKTKLRPVNRRRVSFTEFAR